jgi:hypothetical protein
MSVPVVHRWLDLMHNSAVRTFQVVLSYGCIHGPRSWRKILDESVCSVFDLLGLSGRAQVGGTWPFYDLLSQSHLTPANEALEKER